MKKLFLTLILCISVSAIFAQTKKITIYSTINWDGSVDYADLKKLLPDSVAGKILIDPQKTPGLHKANHILLWMTANGWKLITSTGDVMRGTSFPGYLMSKDIRLDSAAYAIYMYHLVNSEKKPQK